MRGRSTSRKRLSPSCARLMFLTSQGENVAEAIRLIGVSEVTYYLYGRLSLCKTG
jgi:hypothetical protein